MIYNKNEGKGTSIRSKDGKMILFNNIGDWGFINDIDGGPELIPEYVNDSLAFRFISSIANEKISYVGRILKLNTKGSN